MTLTKAQFETARAQNRDRFFTFITSIAQENAFFASGATAGFGFRDPLRLELGEGGAENRGRDFE